MQSRTVSEKSEVKIMEIWGGLGNHQEVYTVVSWVLVVPGTGGGYAVGAKSAGVVDRLGGYYLDMESKKGR